MNPEPLETLLEQLCRGDAAAAERVFRAYEPYLRKVVRRKLPAALQAKFDSLDVVQSIWADLLDGFRDAGWRFADANHLRAFLVKVTRNRFIDRCRRYQTAVKREETLTAANPEDLPPSSAPRPSEVAQAADLWEQLLALCPPAHHELLRLKRQGVSLADIAARTGLHPASIRRILRDLARRFDACQTLPAPCPTAP